jgi:hypothetical protein
LDRVQQGDPFLDFVMGFYGARRLGKIPFNFILSQEPEVRRKLARQFLQGREMLGAIFSTFPGWDGNLPPPKTLQWYWLVQLWRAAERDLHRFRELANGLAAFVGLIIGLNECFQSGYAGLFAKGGIGAALLKLDLYEDLDPKKYRRLLSEIGFPLRRRTPPPRKSRETGKTLVRQEWDELDGQLGEVMAEWLRRPLKEILAEFEKLRFADKRLQDGVRDIWRVAKAQKRGAGVPHDYTSDPVTPVKRGEGQERSMTVEDTLIDRNHGTTPSEVQNRFTDPLVAQQWVREITTKLGEAAGKIATVLVQAGPPPKFREEIAEESGLDRKTVRKYLREVEARLRRFSAS